MQKLALFCSLEFLSHIKFKAIQTAHRKYMSRIFFLDLKCRWFSLIKKKRKRCHCEAAARMHCICKRRYLSMKLIEYGILLMRDQCRHSTWIRMWIWSELDYMSSSGPDVNAPTSWNLLLLLQQSIVFFIIKKKSACVWYLLIETIIIDDGRLTYAQCIHTQDTIEYKSIE